MKFSIVGFFILLVFLSCQKKTIESDCHIYNIIDPLELKFEDGIAHKFSFSPFEKHKVLIEIKNSKTPFLEYNLADSTFKNLDRKNWKVNFLSNAPVYVDHIDTTIWIGGKKELKKVSMKTNEGTTFPFKRVTRMIPYNAHMFFVARNGFFKLDKKTENFEKIDLPFKNFLPTQLLDEQTLIFGNKWTYNLEKNTWEKGVHIYTHSSTEDSRNFKMGKGIAAFPYGKNKVTLVFPNESKLVGLGNNPKILNFQPPLIWKNSKHGIMRYDIEKDQLDTFRFTLPLASDRKIKFKFINEKTITWILKTDQLFFINILTGEKYNYKFDLDEKFISMKVDDCNVYLLFENKLIVKNKEKFILESISYDDKKYIAQLKEFRNFRNSTKISKDTEEIEVVKKLGIIKSKYANLDHPDIQRELDMLNLSAFNSVKYETVPQLEACVRNNKIPLKKRKRCYNILINTEVRNSNFENAILLEKEFLSNVDDENFSPDYKYYTGLDSIKKYLRVVEDLEKLNLAEDTLAYRKAFALNLVCQTTFFCHEGCGGCDFGLVTTALNNFIKAYPNSELQDDAKYDLLEYHHMYEEDIDFEFFLKDFDKFIEENPSSDFVDDAQFRIINIMTYWEGDQKYRPELLKRLSKFENEFPESKHIDWVKERLEKMNES